MKYSELLKKTSVLNQLYKSLVVGIDDGGFKPDYKFRKLKRIIPLFAVYCKGFRIVDVKFNEIIIDGLDATEKVISILKKKRADLIFSAGITVGGFNLIDFYEVFNKTGIPSIIVLDHEPNLASIKQALYKHFEDADIRWKIIEKYPPLKKYETYYYGAVGISLQEAVRLIENYRIFSRYPEPLRLAHLIARAIYKYSLEKESSN